MDANPETGEDLGPVDAPPVPLNRLCRQLLSGWQEFPDAEHKALCELLSEALSLAANAEPQTLTVMNPVSRPMVLRLYALVSDADLDSLYHQEWAELAVSDDGRCYLVYRRSDGGDYGVEWSSATSVPSSVLAALPPVLARAMYERDGGR